MISFGMILANSHWGFFNPWTGKSYQPVLRDRRESWTIVSSLVGYSVGLKDRTDPTAVSNRTAIHLGFESLWRRLGHDSGVAPSPVFFQSEPGGKTCNYRLLQATSIAMCEAFWRWRTNVSHETKKPMCTTCEAAVCFRTLKGWRHKVPEGSDPHLEPQSHHTGDWVRVLEKLL